MKKFLSWYENAKPGDKYVYFSGLDVDRFASNEVRDLFAAVYGLTCRGKILLTTRVLDRAVKYRYRDYIATKATPNIDSKLVPEPIDSTAKKFPKTRFEVDDTV
jgi:hypothetical protein